MPGKILQIDDIRSAFPGRGQGRNAQGVYGDVRVEAKTGDIAADELLNGARGHRFTLETIASHAARRAGSWEEGCRRVIPDTGDGEPGINALDSLQMQGRRAFLTALASDGEDAVLAAGLVSARPSQPCQAGYSPELVSPPLTKEPAHGTFTRSSSGTLLAACISSGGIPASLSIAAYCANVSVFRPPPFTLGGSALAPSLPAQLSRAAPVPSEPASLPVLLSANGTVASPGIEIEAFKLRPASPGLSTRARMALSHYRRTGQPPEQRRPCL